MSACGGTIAARTLLRRLIQNTAVARNSGSTNQVYQFPSCTQQVQHCMKSQQYSVATAWRCVRPQTPMVCRICVRMCQVASRLHPKQHP